MLSCKRFAELITEYFEGKLTLKTRILFELHLHMCKGCPQYLEDLRKVILLSRKIKREELPEKITAKITSAFSKISLEKL
jgi:hypothetical protein